MVVRLNADQAPGWVSKRLVGSHRTRWIGIDGLGAAGKSTLATAVAAALPGAVVVSVDDFARPGTDTWDHELFRHRVLEPIVAGRPGRYQRWDLLTELPGDWVEVPAGLPIVVEGVSCTDQAVVVPWDLRLWVEAGEAVRRDRISRRDPPALLRRWEQDWWPQEQIYLQQQRPDLRADAVVQG